MKNLCFYCLLFILFSCTESENSSPNNNSEEQIVPTDTGTCGVITRDKKTNIKEKQNDRAFNSEKQKKGFKQETDSITETKKREERLKSINEELRQYQEVIDKESQDATPKFGL